MTSKMELYQFFLRHKPVKLLTNLAKDSKVRYASALAKEVDCTYSHTVRILNILEKNGVVEFDKKGRLKTIKLTPAGKEIANCLSRTMTLFDKIER